MNRQQKVLATAIFNFLNIVISGPLLACTCGEESSVNESVKYANIVFRGQVVSNMVSVDLSGIGVAIEGDTTSFASKWTKHPVAVFKIKVEEIYKGECQTDTVSVITPINGAGCGFAFQAGRIYIIYGTANDDVLPGNLLKRFSTNNHTYWTNVCTGTKGFSEAEEDEIKAVLK